MEPNRNLLENYKYLGKLNLLFSTFDEATYFIF